MVTGVFNEGCQDKICILKALSSRYTSAVPICVNSWGPMPPFHMKYLRCKQVDKCTDMSCGFGCVRERIRLFCFSQSRTY